ncbi:TRAP transporter substrate-binding protein [Puniceibacterium sp. IMCC21224]|uniref:TRAP transporter substrate-binding protein n=1 Tax=Puniceibacterium sp. IMCC21224 TaxID=1618204 RepID=UPI00064DF6D7|nr:TRAP transporter substrate-binding protein [Puniceibacterium sp. IMCC21224]KMK64837.1 TRAP-type C4-dicarboxylate transport system, periplasmic component [Puniceibacterium sp. IMCC21224]
MTKLTQSLPRRTLLQLGGAALATPMLMRSAWAQDKFVCKIAHSEAIGSPFTNAFDAWTTILNERSEGRIDAQHFPASQLGGLAQLLEMSRIGTIQVTAAGPDSEEAIAPEIAATAGAPGFIYKNEAHVDAVLQGDIGQEISRIAREKTGVEFVAYGEVGFRHLLTKEPVTDLASLQGVKLRVPEVRIWVDFWKLLGANPTPLPYSEQYSALSTGVIDGLDSDYFSVLGFKWHEQATNILPTYHWFLPKAIRMNAAWLDSLPDDLQELCRSSAKEVFAEQRTVNRAGADQALEDLKAVGCTVHPFAAEEKAKWEEKSASLYDTFGETSPATAAMIAKIQALA